MNNSILDQMLMKAAAPTLTSVGEQKAALVMRNLEIRAGR